MWAGDMKRSLLDDVLRDSAVDVGNDDAIVPVPQVDAAGTASRPLVLGRDGECRLVHPFHQVQLHLRN